MQQSPNPRPEPAPLLPGDGPRFSLRFEAGVGLLRLAKPLPCAIGSIQSLETSVGRLNFPLDVSRGPYRFRHRRSELRSVVLRIQLSRLLALFPPKNVVLHPLGKVEEGGLVWSLRDAFGTLVVDSHLRCDGADLLLRVGQARAIQEGPVPPITRVLMVLQQLNWQYDRRQGALRFPRVIRSALGEALLGHGWRLPEERGLRVRVKALDERVLVLEAHASLDEPPYDVMFDDARQVAPVLEALVVGDADRARTAYERLVERVGVRVGILQKMTRGWGLRPLEREHAGEDALGLSLQLRLAIRNDDWRSAVDLAKRFGAVERSDALAVEAYCSVVELLSTRDEGQAVSVGLLEAAAARMPRDLRLSLRLIEAVAAMGNEERVREVVTATLQGYEPGSERGYVALEAAQMCDLAGAEEAAAELWESAQQDCPSDPRALQGWALALSKQDDFKRALPLFDRAAREYGVRELRDAEAGAERLAALCAERINRVQEAETRLTRALALAPNSRRCAADLARVRQGLNVDAASRAEDALLGLMEAVANGEAERFVLPVLECAITRALVAVNPTRARRFWITLCRVSGQPYDDFGTEIVLLETDRLREEPEILFAMADAQLARAIEKLGDLSSLIVLAEETRKPIPWERLLRAAMLGDVLRESGLGDLSVKARFVPQDLGLLTKLEQISTDGVAKSVYAEALALRAQATEPLRAAEAWARLGVYRRDAAILRRALRQAEQLEDAPTIGRVIDLALSVVGEGPARRALEAKKSGLEGPKTSE